mmetsp:Transcript_11808/g.25056  ORF Transcript_11808/g.25056 Transcript_11808/m.25056 type:complete len:136 (+) Transcript_11808:616-1023(+)
MPPFHVYFMKFCARATDDRPCFQTSYRSNELFHFLLRRFDVGAGMALKLLATFLSVESNLLNLADVVDVTRRNNPFPTIDADIYAFRSLSRIAGVRVVNEAVKIADPVPFSVNFFILISEEMPYIPNFPVELKIT